mmetsp:Transcript_85253/g.260636  ORF Transcript_85253/g.260636 Transcript_85253/m.260636 type:complete len:237 (-) Transcript_85253:8-718(-)
MAFVEKTSMGPWRPYLQLFRYTPAGPSAWSCRCAFNLSGKNTASGSTLTVHSLKRNLPSSMTLFQNAMNIPVFSAVPESPPIPQRKSLSMTPVLRPGTSSISVLLYTLDSSHANMLIFSPTCICSKPISYEPGCIKATQYSVPRGARALCGKPATAFGCRTAVGTEKSGSRPMRLQSCVAVSRVQAPQLMSAWHFSQQRLAVGILWMVAYLFGETYAVPSSTAPHKACVVQIGRAS